jgi:hypothetical protein
MNTKLARQYDIVKMYRKLRDDLMTILNDQDLQTAPGGENETLGALCRELGETQKGYIESFRSFKIEFIYEVEDPLLENSIESILVWYQQLNKELEEVLESLSDSDVDERLIHRTEEFKLPPVIHLDVYRDAWIG